MCLKLKKVKCLTLQVPWCLQQGEEQVREREREGMATYEGQSSYTIRADPRNRSRERAMALRKRKI